MTKTIKCSDCEEIIIIPDDSAVGDIIECKKCATEYQILSISPLQLSPIEEK